MEDNGNPQGHRSERQWEVLFPQDRMTGEVIADREAVQQALFDIEATGHRLGGTFQVAPLRRRYEVERGGKTVTRYEVIGWAFEWSKYLPTVAPADQQVLDAIAAPVEDEPEVEAPVGTD